jgi:hypothetical protein
MTSFPFQRRRQLIIMKTFFDAKAFGTYRMKKLRDQAGAVTGVT